MKAAEFETTVNPGGQIVLPPDLIADIPQGELVRVVLLWDASSGDSAWRESGRRTFEQAYCAADEVYKQLVSNDAQAR